MFDKSIILIPTLNERENLEKLIPGIFDLMPDISVLVIDDNSSDGTWKLVKSMKGFFKNLFLLERKNNFGYGRSNIDGFKWVLDKNYEFLVAMDADFSHDPAEIPVMLKKLSDSDIVVGSRYIKGGGISNWNFKRRILSRFANFYAKAILGIPVNDLTTGFMCLKKNALKSIDPNSIKSDGYAFLIELKYKLHKFGYKIVEHPITFSERREGQSKMSSKIIWEAIKLPWKLKFKL